MTTTTFSPAVAVPSTPAFAVPKGIKALVRFATVFFGLNADKPDHFRGLDLNGNAMWSR